MGKSGRPTKEFKDSDFYGSYKQLFLKQNKNISNPNYGYFRFSESKDFEEKLGKDVYDWSMDEIVSYYKSLGYKDIYSLYNLNSLFKRYTEFCILSNIKSSVENYYDSIPNDVFNICINKRAKMQTILSKQEVLDICQDNRIENPCDKFLILGSFEGLTFEEMLELKSEDVNKEDLTVTTCKGKTVKISPILLRYIEECIAEYTFYYIKNDKQSKFEDNGKVIKKKTRSTYDTLEKRTINYRLEIAKLFEYIDLSYLKVNDIIRSGMVYSLNEILKEKNLTIEQFVNTQHYKDFINFWNKRNYVKGVFISDLSQFVEKQPT